MVGSKQKQEIYLKESRGDSSIVPSVHPQWTTSNWLYYVLTFPLEYALIISFVVPSCILSLLFGIINFIKTLFTTKEALIQNNLKRNLTQSRIFNYYNNATNPQNVILSIIIPCYNESKNIKSTLLYLDLNCWNHNQIEIILVDGNSPDIDALKTAVSETEPLLNIKSSQIKILCKTNLSGRGTCQNIGAAYSKGKYLLFMHADTIPPKNYDQIIRESFKYKVNMLLGAFTFAIDRSLMQYPVPGIGWIECFARIRNKLFSLPYGDQCLWIKRETFLDIGGFKWIPILDDIEFIFRCREIASIQNKIIYIDDNYAYCSPRRWIKHGAAKNTVWNQWVLFLYTQMKFTPQRIYEIYYGREF